MVVVIAGGLQGSIKPERRRGVRVQLKDGGTQSIDGGRVRERREEGLA